MDLLVAYRRLYDHILLDIGKISKDMKYINYFDHHFIKIPCQFYAKHFI